MNTDDQDIPRLEDVERMVEELDPLVKRGSEEFRTALIVLSVMFFGPNVRGIARFICSRRRFVRTRSKRLFDNLIWFPDMTWRMDWYNVDTGEINVASFWLDVLVAMGKVVWDPAKEGFALRDWDKKEYSKPIGDIL